MPLQRLLTVLVLVLGLALAGCGGDDATEGDDQAAGDAERYCALAAELDAQEDMPSEEQLVEIEQAAPAEIADDVRIITAAVRSGDFEDPAAEEADQNLRAWEAENCA